MIGGPAHGGEEIGAFGGASTASGPPARAVSSRAGEAGRPDAAGWTVVVPVKSLTAAKTRLAPELSPAERAELARAFALDTVDAARTARAVRRVVVVSDEPVIERELREVPGVEVVPEVGPRGLAAAIAYGVEVARAAGTAGADVAVAVLLGDVPALRAGDLDAALVVAARHPLAYVPDAEGTGTTLATARADVPLDAHFGQDSAARHAAAGFADLVAEHPAAIAAGLRRDVDTAAELREAVALGVGARTSAVLRTLPDLAEGPARRHPLDPSNSTPTAPAGADRKAAS
jgi:2-phospho-L-lactate guanylyltransferase